MQRRRRRECLLIAAALAGGSVAFAGPVRAQDAGKLEQQLRDLENETQAAVAERIDSHQTHASNYVEQRLTDGELFYRLQDYVRASIILTDIVENYPNHPAAPDATLLLGESLYSAGDYMGARTRLRQLIARSNEPAFQPYAARALGRLIEIAIRTRDFDGVEGYFERLSKLPPQEIEAATSYYRAKYLYNKAVPTDEVTRGEAALQTATIDTAGLNQARQAFESVAESSPYYPQARYFVGVILTLQQQYPQAVEAFSRVLRSKATTREQQQVVELSQIALGRLYYETDQTDPAIKAYQSVPRTSQWFDTALYEIAWVYIRMGDSDRAASALEVLSIAAPDSHYLADASILRGNLLLRDGLGEDAQVVFSETSAKFSPLRDKLDRVISEHSDTQSYFRELARSNIESYDPNSIFPPEAVPFAGDASEMQRALLVLSDLSQARTLVAETAQLIARFEGALGASNRVNVFSDLRRKRERTTAIRNRSVDLRRALLAYLASKHPSSGELAEVRAERTKLEAALAEMPKDSQAFVERDAALLGGFHDVAREISELTVDVLGLDARITATDHYLEDTKDERADNPVGIAAIESELATQRAATANYRSELDKAKLEIEAGRLQIGVGDQRYQHDDEVRAQYIALVERERGLLRANGVSEPAVDGLFNSLASIDATVAKRDADIDRVVEERTTEIQRVLAAEKTNVEGYQTQLGTLETEAETVVGGVTYATFTSVRQRVYDLVLRADVGLIDVAWADREDHRTQVELLTRERTKQITALDDEFKEIMDQPKGDDQ